MYPPDCHMLLKALTMTVCDVSAMQRIHHTATATPWHANGACRGMNDEDQVVALYSNLYKQSGQAFDPQRCRDWYRRCSMRVNNGHCIARPGVVLHIH